MDDVPLRLDFDDAAPRVFVVAPEEAGERLDRYLSARIGEFSRALVQRLIDGGSVKVDGANARRSHRLRDGERIEVDLPRALPARAEPEDLPLRVLLEEESFVVLDKAPGMAVHPGRGRASGTIANAIAFRYGALRLTGAGYRPGIVHRLDLDTSGVMVVAKTEVAHAALSDAFAERRVEKEYLALVHGAPEHDEQRIDLPLGRDHADAQRHAVRFDGGRPAVTDVRVRERFGRVAALVSCRPFTGRTHQIRVHLLAVGHPILGDPLYVRGLHAPVEVARLMLHAFRLVFPHPQTGAPVAVEAPLPADLEAAMQRLREGE
ncbi:MAG TPA: RluA family pseudouridine synthase [Planctomycetota bacterium]|nr:RluA family pseudouridine synthase [Planctomycetota bacterium]